MGKRFLLAALGIVLVSAGATVAIAHNEVSGLVAALDQNKAVHVAPGLLAPTSRGAPETLLLVGNDERPPPADNPSGAVLPHSNEMLLVRIDPSKPTISMLSIPRELWVPIHKPDGEVEENRINSAYTYGYLAGGVAGGVKLMLETIKGVTGLAVNRVFITNFKHFRSAVDEMGCVYMTIDKRYYHVNEPGGEQYFEINLQPGYQRLCGKEALEFVANRHESTSLLRDARDQRFLLEVKSQYGPTLFENREKFERIFGRAVQTANLHTEEQVLQLLDLLIESAGKPVRQVTFPVTLHPVYDTATRAQVEHAVRSFLGGTAAIRRAPAPRVRRRRRTRRTTRPAAPVHQPTLAPTSAEELAAAEAKTPFLPFPLEYPRARAQLGGAEPDMLRLYHLRDQHGHAHATYVVVIDRGELGQYYDVQGTTWSNPPLLANPEGRVSVAGRTYELFYAGEALKTIAWREHGAVYWIENTLTNGIPAASMLAMAEETTPVLQRATRAPGSAARSARRVRLAPPVKTSGKAARIAAALGALAVAVVALLSLLVLARQRELRSLRERTKATEERERQLAAEERLIAAARIPPRRVPVGAGAGPSPAPPPAAALTAAPVAAGAAAVKEPAPPANAAPAAPTAAPPKPAADAPAQPPGPPAAGS